MEKTENGHDSDETFANSFGMIQVTLILQLSRSGAWYRHRVFLPVKAAFSAIKMDMEQMLNIPGKDQKWTYQHTELDDTDCMYNLRIKPNDFIVVTTKA